MADKIKTGTPEFSTPSKVFDVCERMQTVENKRSGDRGKINTLFNGQRPYSDDEAVENNIQINVNWGAGKRIMIDANRQLNNALLHSGTMFSCSLEDGNVSKRDQWSISFMKNIHKPLQRGQSGKAHYNLIKSRNATIAMHGIGALLWPNDWNWMARFVPLEDLLIPTDTYCDFSNIRYFAVNLYLSPGEFADMTHGTAVDAGWNMDKVNAILDFMRDQFNASTPSTWRSQPEAMMEIFKQNQWYYYSDALPKIRLRAFYCQSIEKPHKWYRHVVLREAVGDVGVDKFIYDGTKHVFADHISQIINVQYGDSSLVAPFNYHSVRGLGVDLYAPFETLNRLQCEFVQHVFEQLKMYFRIQDPSDRDRLKQVMLSQYGFIPEGLQFVKREERHQVDGGLVESAMGQMRQVMQESSSSFIQDTDNGTQKEMTAFEAQARVSQANVMVSGMLMMLYLQENFYYEELVRRFCKKDSADEEVQAFQKACIRDGIPKELLDASKWRITPERVLGGGDQTLAQAQANWLFERRAAYEPASQQKILRMVTTTMLNDPAKALNLVPDAPPQATDGTFAAENVFATLMQGVQCALRQGVDQIGYIEALLKMMATVVQRIQNTDNMGTIDEIIGLQNVAQNVGQHIMVLAGDESEKQRVRQYSDVLGQLMNEVKGFASRLMQSQESQQSQGDPAAQAKIQSTIMLAQTKSQIAESNAAMKQRHKDIQFQMDQARDNMRLAADIKRENIEHQTKIFNSTMGEVGNMLRGLKSAPGTNSLTE